MKSRRLARRTNAQSSLKCRRIYTCLRSPSPQHASPDRPTAGALGRLTGNMEDIGNESGKACRSTVYTEHSEEAARRLSLLASILEPTNPSQRFHTASSGGERTVTSVPRSYVIRACRADVDGMANKVAEVWRRDPDRCCKVGVFTCRSRCISDLVNALCICEGGDA